MDGINIGLQGAIAQDDGASNTGGEVPDVRVEVTRPLELYDGYLFWHRTDELGADFENYSVLVDGDGSVVHRWETNISGGGVSAYLLSGGRILRMGASVGDAAGGDALAGVPQASVVQIADARGDILWEVRPGDVGVDRFHHDMVPMPNGNILILTYTLVTAEEAGAIGWELEGAATALSDGIVEVRPNLDDGSAEVVWAWHFHDHIIQDRNPEAPNYGVIADHPERIDGDLLFRYGNPAVYDMGTRADRVFLKQHDPNWVDAGLPGAGNLLIFNNNIQIGPGFGGLAGMGMGAMALEAQRQYAVDQYR